MHAHKLIHDMPDVILQDSDRHVLGNTHHNRRIYHAQAAPGFGELLAVLCELLRKFGVFTAEHVKPCPPLAELPDE